MPITDQSVIPSPSDVLLARESTRLLGHLRGDGSQTIGIRVGNKTVEIPGVLKSVLFDALSKVAEGKGIAITTIEEELSPQEAAEILNVSRPFASKLFDEGKIPSRKVGTHRRALARDVLAYKEQEKQARLNALSELSAHDQSLNMGY